MVLHNVESLESELKNIRIAGNRVAEITTEEIAPSGQSDQQIYFEDCIVFPGLINSHEHLEFNLFPQLGHRLYQNYLDWGADIHQRNKALINAVLKVPKALRAEWGMYKNLLNGVTTVVQHGDRIELPNALIEVFTRCHSLHSVGLEKLWMWKLNNPFARPQPFVVHVGEGVDGMAKLEATKLMRWNLLRRKLIGVHGVGMSVAQARSFEALVWCPDSNLFLLGASAPVSQLKSATRILFGTDSTVSAHWSIWHHLRLARSMQQLSDQSLISAVTSEASHVWKLSGTGAIEVGNFADLVVARKQDRAKSAKENFFTSAPETLMLIMSKGSVILFDESLAQQIGPDFIQGFSRVHLNNTTKYVRGDLPGLVRKIRQVYPDAIFPISID